MRGMSLAKRLCFPAAQRQRNTASVGLKDTAGGTRTFRRRQHIILTVEIPLSERIAIRQDAEGPRACRPEAACPTSLQRGGSEDRVAHPGAVDVRREHGPDRVRRLPNGNGVGDVRECKFQLKRWGARREPPIFDAIYIDNFPGRCAEKPRLIRIRAELTDDRSLAAHERKAAAEKEAEYERQLTRWQCHVEHA